MRVDKIILMILFVVVLAEIKALAYADPGSGALILQILLGALFGVMFYIRRIIAWTRRRLRGEKDESNKQPLPVEAKEESSDVIVG
jgi:hypothetical protein